MWKWHLIPYCFCSSVAQSCLTLCVPMDGSTPGIPVPHHLLKFAQVHVYCVGDAIQPSHPLTPSSPSVLSLSQYQGLFQWVICLHQFISVQMLSPVWLFATPWTAAHQASLSIINSQSLLKFMSIKSVMPSNHLILCCPLLLLPSIFPSVRVFFSELILCIRWPKYWSFSFSISPFSEYSGLISFRIDWFYLLAVQGTLKSLLQHHSSKASILWCSSVCIRWPKYSSFSFIISPSYEYSGLISLKTDWFDLLAVQGTFRESSPAPQLESINSLAFCLLYSQAFFFTYATIGKTIGLDYVDLCWQCNISAVQHTA